MDLLTPVITGALLAFFTGVQVWINKGRFDALDRRMDGLERRFEAHGQSNERRFEQLAAEIAALRSDLTQIALAVGGRTQTG